MGALVSVRVFRVVVTALTKCTALSTLHVMKSRSQEVRALDRLSLGALIAAGVMLFIL